MKSLEIGGKMLPIEAGDVLQCLKGLVTHMGIALANGMVFHNTPEKGEHVSTLAEFAQGQAVTVVKSNPEVRSMTLRGVQSALKNPQKYSLLFNNCEHTVTRVTKGGGSSSQIVFGMIVCGFLGYLMLKD